MKCGSKGDRIYDNMCEAYHYGGERKSSCSSLSACPKADKNIVYPILPQICDYMYRSGPGGTRQCEYVNPDAAKSAGFSVKRDCREAPFRKLEEEVVLEDTNSKDDTVSETESQPETLKVVSDAAEEESMEERSLRIDVCYNEKIRPVVCGSSRRFYDNVCYALEAGERKSKCSSVSSCPKADEDIFYPIAPVVCDYMYRSGPGGTRQCKYANSDAARSAGFSATRDCRRAP